MRQTQPAITLFAIFLMLSGPALVLTVYFGVSFWLEHLARIDPVPDQNAIVLGFLGDIISLVIGVAITVSGLSLCKHRLNMELWTDVRRGFHATCASAGPSQI